MFYHISTVHKQETNNNSDVFFVLEAQNNTSIEPRVIIDSDFDMKNRLLLAKDLNKIKKVLIQYAFGDDSNEQKQLFASYYYRVATMPRVTRIREMLPGKLGSKLLLGVSKWCQQRSIISKKIKKKFFF